MIFTVIFLSFTHKKEKNLELGNSYDKDESVGLDRGLIQPSHNSVIQENCQNWNPARDISETAPQDQIQTSSKEASDRGYPSINSLNLPPINDILENHFRNTGISENNNREISDQPEIDFEVGENGNIEEGQNNSLERNSGIKSNLWKTERKLIDKEIYFKWNSFKSEKGYCRRNSKDSHTNGAEILNEDLEAKEISEEETCVQDMSYPFFRRNLIKGQFSKRSAQSQIVSSKQFGANSKSFILKSEKQIENLKNIPGSQDEKTKETKGSVSFQVGADGLDNESVQTKAKVLNENIIQENLESEEDRYESDIFEDDESSQEKEMEVDAKKDIDTAIITGRENTDEHHEGENSSHHQEEVKAHEENEEEKVQGTTESYRNNTDQDDESDILEEIKLENEKNKEEVIPEKLNEDLPQIGCNNYSWGSSSESSEKSQEQDEDIGVTISDWDESQSNNNSR